MVAEGSGNATAGTRLGRPRSRTHVGVAAAARAPAKVNLSLHVLGRREDGYHVLESLVAFAGTCDHLELTPGETLALEVTGPTAAMAGPVDDNLILRAARALATLRPGLRVGVFRLVKNLPAAAGIGGGSSDAAAALRLLATLNGIRAGDALLLRVAAALGADIPACLAPRARMMRGIGAEVGAALDLPPLFAVLVNPRVAVPTPAVFAKLGLAKGQCRDVALHPDPLSDHAHPDPAGLIGRLAELRNDLEPVAIGLAPAIGDALDRLRGTAACRFARMSGSGATVFGLYDDRIAAVRAAKALRRSRPDWWIRPTLLR